MHAGGAVKQDLGVRICQSLQRKADPFPEQLGRLGKKVIFAAVPKNLYPEAVADLRIVKLFLHIHHVSDSRLSQLAHILGSANRATHSETLCYEMVVNHAP